MSTKIKLTNAPTTKEDRARNAVHLPFSLFPADLRATLEELDEGGNGTLEFSEIVAMVKNYAELRKSEQTGSIPIDMLPTEIHKTLAVWDVDGDGTVNAQELDKAASLYLEKLAQVKMLTRIAIATFVVLLCLLILMSLTTLAVVEGTKETKAGVNGVQRPADDDTMVAATAAAVVEDDLFGALNYTAARLRDVQLLTLPISAGVTYMFQVLSSTLNANTSSYGTHSVEFYTGVKGHVVNVTESRYFVAKEACTDIACDAVHIVERNSPLLASHPAKPITKSKSTVTTAPVAATGRR